MYTTSKGKPYDTAERAQAIIELVKAVPNSGKLLEEFLDKLIARAAAGGLTPEEDAGAEEESDLPDPKAAPKDSKKAKPNGGRVLGPKDFPVEDSMFARARAEGYGRQDAPARRDMSTAGQHASISRRLADRMNGAGIKH